MKLCFTIAVPDGQLPMVLISITAFSINLQYIVKLTLHSFKILAINILTSESRLIH